MPDTSRVLKFSLLVMFLLTPTFVFGQQDPGQDPDFSFIFGTYDGRGGPHTDTFDIWAGKPVKSMTLSLLDPDPIQLADPDTKFLLDLSSATIVKQTNTSTELSISVVFDPGSELIGQHVAAQVTFEGLFHSTIAVASGVFLDGSTFDTFADVGFIPEPSTLALMLSALGAVALRRRKS